MLVEDDEDDEEQEAELVLDDAPVSAGEAKAQTPPARERGRKRTSGADGGSYVGGVKRKRSKEGKASAESVDRGLADAESEEEEGGRRKRKEAKGANGVRGHEEAAALEGAKGGKRTVRGLGLGILSNISLYGNMELSIRLWARFISAISYRCQNASRTFFLGSFLCVIHGDQSVCLMLCTASIVIPSNYDPRWAPKTTMFTQHVSF